MSYNAARKERDTCSGEKAKKTKSNKQEAGSIERQKLLFSLKGTQGKQEGYCWEKFTGTG